jgi:TetR/AcrR family transcriptional repressor of nem operon
MRVTRDLQAGHRAAMLEQAGRLFRAHGIGGVAVAEITRAAGLTHGAFYGHFASKTALVAEACRDSLAQAAARWRRRAARAATEGRDPVGELIDAYLTEAHRDAPETGCMLACLGAETVREPALRRALGEGTALLADAMAAALALGRPAIPPPRRDAVALAVLAAMNGGLQLARALADLPERSDAALQAAREAARHAAAAA